MEHHLPQTTDPKELSFKLECVEQELNAAHFGINYIIFLMSKLDNEDMDILQTVMSICYAAGLRRGQDGEEE